MNCSFSYAKFGCVGLNRRDFFSSNKDLKKDLFLNPKEPFANYYYGRFLISNDEYSKALPYFDLAIKGQKKEASFYSYRAMSHTVVKNYSEAIEDYLIAIVLDSSDASNYLNLGFTYYKIQKYDLAFKYYGEAIKKGDVMGFSNRGKLYYELKQYEKVILDLNKAVKKMPKAMDVLYYRGLVYKEQGEKEQACKDFEICCNAFYSPAVKEYQKCISSK